MAAICPRWGCLKKARRVEMGEGSLKKPDVIRSPRNKRQKNLEVPVRLGFLGLPIDRSKGPRRNFQEIPEGCDAAWAAWLVIQVEGISRKLPHAIECDQIHGMFARAY